MKIRIDGVGISRFFAIWMLLFFVVPIIKAPFLGGTYSIIMAFGIIGWLITALRIDSSFFFHPTPTRGICIAGPVYYFFNIRIG